MLLHINNLLKAVPVRGRLLFYLGQPDLLLVQMLHPRPIRRVVAHFALKGRQGVYQVPPLGFSIPQPLKLAQRPVVSGEEVVEQTQLPVRAVP